MNLLKEKLFSSSFFLSPAPQHWNAQFFLQQKLSLVQVLGSGGLSRKLKIESFSQVVPP